MEYLDNIDDLQEMKSELIYQSEQAMFSCEELKVLSLAKQIGKINERICKVIDRRVG